MLLFLTKEAASLTFLLVDLLVLILLFFSSVCNALCPLKCICNEKKLAVWCNGAGIDIVPITLNPQLEKLFLTNNHIKNILGAFNVYRKLKYLDMSNNRVSSLGANNFIMQKNMEVFHISHNMIDSIQNGSFAGLNKARILNLRENLLKEINNGALRSLENLEDLDISKNRLQRVEDHAFLGLDNLKSLTLRDNLLTHIPAKSFQDIPKLKLLDLGYNSLKVISAHSFLHLTELEELRLDGCEIHTIRWGSFKNMIKLKNLHLQNNLLNEVPSVALGALSNLLHLRIGENKIQAIQVLSLRGLYSLRSLSVDGSPYLSSVHEGAFADNSQLERVSLNYNKVLSHLDSEVFHGLNNLKEVRLRGNKMVTMSKELLEWNRLEAFDVRDNPLECNCSLLWLRDYYRKLNMTYFQDKQRDFTNVLCDEPPFLRGVLLVDSTEDDLGCNRLYYIQIWAMSAIGTGFFIVSLVIVVIWYRTNMNSRLKAKYQADEKIKSSVMSIEYPEEKVVMPLMISGVSKTRTATMV